MKRHNPIRYTIALVSLLFILLIPTIAKGQYVGRSTLKSNIQKDTLIDSTTGVKFIIDTARIYITAIDTNGNQLWKTDPVVDAKIEAYRVQRPVIVYFVFETDSYNKNKQIIAITYNNSQFGYINKLTGKFDFLGQD
ncbi:MAG: hypothetical protein V4613_02375 [Bacteroidota bacterium]